MENKEKIMMYNTKSSIKYVAAIMFALYLFIQLFFGSIGKSFAAASATISISPTAVGVTQGSSTVVTVNINAAANNITAAQACVSYDTSKIQLTNTDYTTSPLGTTTPSGGTDCPAGQIQLSRYTLPPFPNGTFALAKLTFKALVAGGTTTVSVNNGSSYIYDDTGTATNILVAPAGSSVLSLESIPAAPPSASPSTPAAQNPPASTPSVTDTSRKNKSETATSPQAIQATSSDVQEALPSDTPATNVVSSKKNKSTYTVYIIVGVVLATFAAAIVAARAARKRGLYNTFHFGQYVAKNDHVDVDISSATLPKADSTTNGEQMAPKVIEPESSHNVDEPKHFIKNENSKS